MALERHQSMTFDAERGEPLCPAQLRQIDDEGGADDLAAGTLDELDRGLGGAAGGDQVVDDQDPLARIDGVLMHLDDVDAIFERVFLANGFPRQLALFAKRDEAAAEPIGDCSPYDKAARLDPCHVLDPGGDEG